MARSATWGSRDRGVEPIARGFGTAEWALLGLTASAWGASFLFIDVAVEHLRPSLLCLLWVGFGAAALAVLPSARRPVLPSDIPVFGLLGLTWMAAPFLLFSVAEQSIDSALAGMLDGATPLFTALVGFAATRRRPARRPASGLALGFTGVVCTGLPSLTGTHASAMGVTLALLATLCYGVAINVAGPLQQRYGALAVVWRTELAATAWLAPAALTALPSSTFALPAVLAAAGLGCLCGGVANVTFTILLGRVGPTRAAVTVYFPPVVALTLGALARHERVSPISLLGTAVMLGGAWLATRAEPKGRPRTSSRPGRGRPARSAADPPSREPRHRPLT